MESLKSRLESIKHVFHELDYPYVEPIKTTIGAINRGEEGMFRGVYYIYPEVNFYFGKAQSKKGCGTIYHRHMTHRPKLDVDLSALYGPPRIKMEPNWQFPKGFQEGVAKYLLDDCEYIPDHFEKITDVDGKKKCKPANLDFKVKHKVDIDTLSVLVWNLDDFSEDQIKNIEDTVIHKIWPYCNAETSRKRHKKK